MKSRALAVVLGLSLLFGTLLAPLSADSMVRRGQFCAKAKLGFHLDGMTCTHVGGYNRWK
jgi:hypothetical protein